MGKCLMRFFSTNQVNKIRGGAIKILEDVGIRVGRDEAKELLLSSGARADESRGTLHIPAEIIEQCLKGVPRRVVLGGRKPKNDVVIDPGIERLYTRSLSGMVDWRDYRDGKLRQVLRSDLKDWAYICDALENLDMASTPTYSDPGLNLNARDVGALEVLFENTTKHVELQPLGKKNLEYLIELAIADLGSKEELKARPRFSVMLSPVSPLQYHGLAIDVMFLAGKYGIPIIITPMGICGATMPVTLAGAVTLTMAEAIAGVVICQLANPGAPLLFHPATLTMDMSTGLSLLGGIESSMMYAAETQVAKEAFGWPVEMCGPITDSYLSDGQSVIERCFSTTLPAYAGADIISGAGNCGTSIIADPVQLVIDNELYGMTLRAVRGIEVNDDTMALDAIARVGAGSGRDYLIDEHTLKYYKTEHFRPKIFTRVRRELWEAEGAKDLNEKAKERIYSILKEHKPEPPDEAVVKEMRAIVKEAEREIQKTSTA